ncbi:MAG: hypothetical protein OYH76_10185 [Defluviicoccus sp.]|nr:hypothetical protein [Defluviicoccus sp.]MDE0276253.1 hypothetical protein [Defluviicoccus sp.]
MNGRPWQAAALERFTIENADAPWPEHRCAPLSNPAAEREIDAILLGDLWPGVEEALRGTRFTALVGGDGDPAGAIEPLHRHLVTRALNVVIEDAKDPTPRTWRPWYCRFVIEASIDRYMVRRTTILSFPEDFEMAKLTRFLREPLMQGCPPSLSWYEGVDGPGAYNLELATGEGADWGLRGRTEAREAVRGTVAEHLEVIEAMDRLSENWRDAAAFNTLHRLATDANATY